MPTLFSLNVNKIALLRNSRGTNYPKLEDYIERAITYGVRSITVHPRPDQRHIKYDDLPLIKQIVDSYSDIELNIEGYPCDKFIHIVNKIQPNQVTLVPDAANQLTSDHGWNLEETYCLLKEAVSKLKVSNSRIILFWDPQPIGLDQLHELGVSGIELYTEPYANSHIKGNYTKILEKYRLVYDCAKKLGMKINAGHDLNQTNLGPFLKRCPVDEVSIGHAFFVEAIDDGFRSSLSSYLKICKEIEI